MRKWLVVIVLLASAACGVSTDDGPHLTADRDVPFDLLDRDAPRLVPPATAAVTEPVLLCFVQGDHLQATTRPLDTPVSLTDVVAALQEPAADVSTLRTAIAPGLVTGVAVLAGVARVDLSPTVSSLGGNNQVLAVAQLVCTLTARPGVGQLSFTLEGAPVEVPRADGSLTSQPVSRDDYAQLLAPQGPA